MPVNDYATLAELKESLPMLGATIGGTTYDSLLEACITRASRAIDRQTYRAPGAFYVTDDSTQYFQPYGLYQTEVFILDLADTPTSVSLSLSGTASYTALTTTDYWLYPYNALDNGQPYYRLDVNTVSGSYQYWPYYPRCVQMVGKFGYSLTPPADVTEITIIQAGRWFKRAQLAFQDKVAFMDKMPSFTYMNAIDRDLATEIAHLRRARLSTTAGG